MLKLLSTDRVYGDGYHNAFTDLIRWQDHDYCIVRQMTVQLVVVPRSANGVQ